MQETVEATQTFGLGLSGKDFSNIPDWELFGYGKQDYTEFLLFQKGYEVDNEDDEE